MLHLIIAKRPSGRTKGQPVRVRERTLQAPQWATRIGCSPRAEKLIRADTTLDHSQKAERAEKLIRTDTTLDHNQKAESADPGPASASEGANPPGTSVGHSHRL